MSEDITWHDSSFRQSVINTINGAFQTFRVKPKISIINIENEIFLKFKNKDEYFSVIAQLINRIRETSLKNKNPQNAGDGSGSGVGNNGNPGGVQGQSGMPDPINALQILATQGTRNIQPQMMGGGHQGTPVISNQGNMTVGMASGNMIRPRGASPQQMQQQMPQQNGGNLNNQMQMNQNPMNSGMQINQLQMGGVRQGNFPENVGHMQMNPDNQPEMNQLNMQNWNQIGMNDAITLQNLATFEASNIQPQMMGGGQQGTPMMPNQGNMTGSIASGNIIRPQCLYPHQLQQMQQMQKQMSQQNLGNINNQMQMNQNSMGMQGNQMQMGHQNVSGGVKRNMPPNDAQTRQQMHMKKLMQMQMNQMNSEMQVNQLQMSGVGQGNVPGNQPERNQPNMQNINQMRMNQNPLGHNIDEGPQMMPNQGRMYGGTVTSCAFNFEDEDLVFVGNLKVKKKQSDSDLCCICLDKEVNSVLIQCGHLATCFECAELHFKDKRNRCPICRAIVERFIKTYRS